MAAAGIFEMTEEAPRSILSFVARGPFTEAQIPKHPLHHPMLVRLHIHVRVRVPNLHNLPLSFVLGHFQTEHLIYAYLLRSNQGSITGSQHNKGRQQ